MRATPPDALDGSASLTRAAADGGRGGDGLPLDDWLRDEGTIDWFSGASAAAPADEPRPRRFLRSEGPASVAGLPAPRVAPAYLRRRLVGLAALVALLVAASVALLVSGGGGRPTGSAATHSSVPPAAASGGSVTSPSSPAASSANAAHTAPAPRIALPRAGTLRLGDTGSLVRVLQQALGRLGFSVGKVDGNFGPLTAEAVVAFQRAHGLATDGVVGSHTAARIDSALAAATSR